MAEEIPPLKLTPALRAVLRVLAANYGSRLPVATLAREARLSAATVRVALADLGRSRLVRHTLAPGADRLPPRTVYWLTGDGLALATGQPVV